MKMKLIMFLKVFYCLIICSSIVRALDEQSVKKGNATIFNIAKSDEDEPKTNIISIPNEHRAGENVSKNPLLKISFPNTEILKVENVATTDMWSLTMKDSPLLNISVTNIGSDTTKHTLHWLTGPDEKGNNNREVCFLYDQDKASWYNTYQSIDPKWPMNTKHAMAKYPFNSVFNWNWNDATDEFCCKLEHMFVNTNGFGVILDETCPWFIRRDKAGLLCFSVNDTYPYSTAFGGKKDSSLDIQLHIFSDKNIRTVTDYIVHTSGLIPKPTEIPDEREFRYPSWMTSSQKGQLNQTGLLAFANQIVKNGFSNKSGIIVDSKWESVQGDFKFNTHLYANAADMLQKLNKLGFSVKLQINGQYNSDSEIAKRHFIKDSQSGKPFLHFIDFSNPESSNYYRLQLELLMANNYINSFLVNLAWPLANFNVTDATVQKQQALLLTKYLETVNFKSSTSDSFFAYKTQHLKTWLQMYENNKNLTEMLSEFVSVVLPLSIGGYSFISPYMIGGPNQNSKPSEEVYIRWVQAAAFMPTMVFYHAPWEISDNAVKITHKMLFLREQIIPVLLKFAKKRITDGQPLIRPMVKLILIYFLI